MDTNFYVYRYIRLDKNTPFYVGKGRGRRAKILKQHNSYCIAVAMKVGFEIEIILDSLTEDQAFAKEIEFIKMYKALGYCEANFTNGGDGRAGCKHKPETIEKMKKHGHKVLGRRHSKETKKALSILQRSGKDSIVNGHKKQAVKLKGRTKDTHFGIKIISDKNKGAGNGRAIFNVITPDGVFETLKDVAKFYNISTASVHMRLKNPRFNWKKVLKDSK